MHVWNKVVAQQNQNEFYEGSFLKGDSSGIVCDAPRQFNTHENLTWKGSSPFYAFMFNVRV